MAQGPGKYDSLATQVREAANASGVVVIIINGDQGIGFSVQGSLEMTYMLPDFLEHIARKIRADIHQADAASH